LRIASKIRLRKRREFEVAQTNPIGTDAFDGTVEIHRALTLVAHVREMFGLVQSQANIA
jgi:hypothetical protein